jgi:hypothetical protein
MSRRRADTLGEEEEPGEAGGVEQIRWREKQGTEADDRFLWRRQTLARRYTPAGS